MPPTSSIAAWIAAVSSVLPSPFAPLSMTLTTSGASGGGSQFVGALDRACADGLSKSATSATGQKKAASLRVLSVAITLASHPSWR